MDCTVQTAAYLTCRNPTTIFLLASPSRRRRQQYDQPVLAFVLTDNLDSFDLAEECGRELWWVSSVLRSCWWTSMQ